jgi:putative serine protease PepD
MGGVCVVAVLLLLAVLNPLGGTYTDSASLVRAAQPSVVEIRARLPEGVSVGSGFVLDRSGLIVTNRHVIDSAIEAVVILDDERRLPVQGFILADKVHDMAVLKVDFGDSRPPALRLCKTLSASGERVMAIGSPQAVARTVSDGIVRNTLKGSKIRELIRDKIVEEWEEAVQATPQALDAQVEMFLTHSGISWLDKSGDNITWIQTNAEITHGNSGGPLINFRKEVVGVNTLGFSVDKFGEGFNFAVSAHHIRTLLEEFPDRKVRPLSDLP